MRVDGIQAHACGVHPGDHQVSANVALVSEEVLLQHRHTCDDAGFPAGREGVEFQVRGDDGGGEFRVGGGASARAPYLRSDVVKLLAILGTQRASDF